ncbi:MAG TPA: NAD-binding protein [Bacillota bacterium]|jgi:nucleotide sugar dehydrogenase
MARLTEAGSDGAICVVGLGNIGENLYRSLVSRVQGEVIGIDIEEPLVRRLRRQGVRAFTALPSGTPISAYLIAISVRGDNLARVVEGFDLSRRPLISIESTVPLGTTGRVAAKLAGHGLAAGRDYFLITCPHRIMFGQDQSVFDPPRVIAGVTPACLKRGTAFYSHFVPRLLPVSQPEVAELAKMAENAYRFVDIAFAEELSMICGERGLDFSEVREAMNTKGNINLPGVECGIGGECLPKDIRLLQEAKYEPKSALFDGAVNADRRYREDLVGRVLAGRPQRVLVRGVSYKKGTAQLKFSKAVELVKALEGKGVAIDVSDETLTPAELIRAGFHVEEAGADYDVIIERGRIEVHPAKSRVAAEAGLMGGRR